MRETMRRRASIETLLEQLADTDREIVEAVKRFSLVTGSQIRRLYFHQDGNGRTDEQRARRALLRLTKLLVLVRLKRRIGGVKSGSEGFCYCLGREGERLIRWWESGEDTPTRQRPEPGERFVHHRLAVTELCVKFIEAARTNRPEELEVLEFEAEPLAWRSFADGFVGRQRILKPDAFMRLGIGDFEYLWFCEIDLGTVSRRARESQASAYRAYWRSRESGDVMPRVLWVAVNQLVTERALAAIHPAGETGGLFVITTPEQAVEVATRSPSEARS